MILSKSGEYGVQIVLHLAEQDPRGYVPVRELSQQCGIPFHFLGKICQRLTRGGILDSYKGPNGGVALSRPAERITVLQVVEALDGLEGFPRCVLGLDLCDDDVPCPLHVAWGDVKTRILRMFSGKTVARLAHELSDGKTTLQQTAGTAAGLRALEE